MLTTAGRRGLGRAARTALLALGTTVLVLLLVSCGGGRATSDSHDQFARSANTQLSQQYRALLFGPPMGARSAPSGASGSRENSFGDTGFVTLPYGTWAGAAATAMEPNGQIVTAGETRIDGRKEIVATRMNSNGSLDLSFGLLGVTTVDIGGDAAVDSGAAIAVQQDGKIVIAGTGRVNGHLVFAAVRLDSNGNLDSSFGAGGVVTIPIGTAAIATAVVVEPSGRIVLAGSARAGGALRFAAVTLNVNGTLDSDFGSGGVAILPQQGGAWGMVAMPDGSLVLGGQGSYQGNQAYVAARILPDGKPDRDFGRDGTVILPMGTYAIGQAIASTPNGNLAFTGDVRTSAGGQVVTVEMHPNGSLDRSFGTHGVARFQGWGVNTMAVDSSGRIVLAGTGVAVVRLTGNGSPDLSFGSDGRVIDGVGSAAAANGMAIDAARDRYVLAGAAKIDGKTEILVMSLRS